MVLYEYPCNERVRALLRVEHLFNRLFFFAEGEDPRYQQIAVATLFDVLDICDRTDLRGSILQDLERQRVTLAGLRQHPGVDPEALENMLNEIQSVSGDLVLTLNSGDVDASSVSGDLTLNGRLDGEVSVETVSGNMCMDNRGERLRRLSASTVSGDVQLKVALATDGEISMESVSGDLVLIVPRDLSAEVSGESFSGDLSAPDAKIEREEFGPGSSFHTRYGAGKGEVRIETFSGDATLRLQ